MTSHNAIPRDAAAPTCGLDDYVMTVLGIRTADAQEGDSLVRRLSGGDLGPGSFAVLKLVSVALFFAAYWALEPAVVRPAVPLPPITLGTIVTARNTRTIRRCV